LQDVHQRAIKRVRELKEAGQTEAAQRLQSVVQRSTNTDTNLNFSAQTSLGSLFGSAFSSLKGAVQASFADGGIVTQPTVGLVGEAGPEAIIPLRHGMGALGGGGVVVNILGDVHAERDAAERMGNQIGEIIKMQLKLNNT